MRSRIVLVIFAVLLAQPASAQDLNPDTGQLVLDQVDYLDGFEAPNSLFAWMLGTRPVLDTTQLFDPDAAPLEGGQVLAIGGVTDIVHIDLRQIASRFDGQRVEVKLWAQPQGTFVDAAIHWKGTPDQMDGIGPLSLSLMPTGRATSDGWRELSTGPVDWVAMGSSPVMLRLQDSLRLDSTPPFGGPPLYGPDAFSRVHIDALTITDLGPAEITDGACRFLTQETDCGPLGVCALGQCVEGSIVAGAPPHREEGRQANLDSRYHLYEVFHAERSRVARLPDFRADLDALLTVPPHQFYPGLGRAISDARFGHGSAPQTGSGISSGLCLGAGVADQLPGAPQQPLVFWSDPANMAFGVLQPGDALTAIDGLDVSEWMTLDRANPLVGAPPPDPFLQQPFLADLAATRGSVLTFARCPHTDGSPCLDTELVSYDIDMAQVFGGTLDGGTLPPPHVCDFRFQRPGGLPPNGADGDSIGTTMLGAGMSMVGFNGFFPMMIDTWVMTMTAQMAMPSADVILDTRFGGGGQAQLMHMVTAPFIDPSVETVFWNLPDMALDDPAIVARLDECRTAPPEVGCESFYGYISARGDATTAPNVGANLALLGGYNASANEYLILALRERAAPFRVFSSTETFGALALVSLAPRFVGEAVGPGFQPVDAVRYDSLDVPLAPPFDFFSGFGLPPDEVCLQTQSDAVQGIDTCIERARTWLEAQ